MTDTEREAGITIHKTSAIGPTEVTDAEMRRRVALQVGSATYLDLVQAFREPIPYTIGHYRVAPPEPLWSLNTVGRPKRNKSKLKQQRESRRRNR